MNDGFKIAAIALMLIGAIFVLMFVLRIGLFIVTKPIFIIAILLIIVFKLSNKNSNTGSAN